LANAPSGYLFSRCQLQWKAQCDERPATIQAFNAVAPVGGARTTHYRLQPALGYDRLRHIVKTPFAVTDAAIAS
jgi:hypothetical protein